MCAVYVGCSVVCVWCMMLCVYGVVYMCGMLVCVGVRVYVHHMHMPWFHAEDSICVEARLVFHAEEPICVEDIK